MIRPLLLGVSLFLFANGMLLAQCALEFENQGPVFDPEDSFTIRICYQDEDLGFPQYAKADWDANDNNDPTDAGEIEVDGGTIVSVTPLGTGNTFQSSYCLDVTISVGYGIAMTITASATGTTTLCTASGEQNYIVLPVEYTYFDLQPVDKGVQLNWQTSTEVNNEYFTVQRSVDGVNFDDLAKVLGAGNSNDLTDYTYRDERALDFFAQQISVDQSLYYRLKQTDTDGISTFSEIRSIRLDDVTIDKNSIVVIQTKDMGLNLQTAKTLDQEHLLRILDLQGRVLKEEWLSAGLNTFDIQLTEYHVNAQILLIQISGPQLKQTKKIFW
jgi:hypothetical protein